MAQTATCTECTWTAENEDEEQLIKDIQDHYKQVHNNEITREEAMDMIHPVEEGEDLVGIDEEMTDEDLGVEKNDDE